MTVLGASDEGRLRALLDSLGYDLEPSILIGGWATNARVGGEISHDIDLIITDQSLRQRLPQRLTGYSENQLHSGGRKARGDADGVHVDAYFPYESKLGSKLLLDVEVLTRYVDPHLKVEGCPWTRSADRQRRHRYRSDRSAFRLQRWFCENYSRSRPNNLRAFAPTSQPQSEGPKTLRIPCAGVD